MPDRVQVAGDLFHGRVPAGAVYVGRAAPGLRRSPWANPFRVGKPVPIQVPLAGDMWLVPGIFGGGPHTPREAVAWYEALLDHVIDHAVPAAQLTQELHGRDLACWCHLDDTCHADVLIAAANTPEWRPCLRVVTATPAGEYL